MTLKDFLEKRTEAEQLCVIHSKGCILGTAYINRDGSYSIASDLLNREVLTHSWEGLNVRSRHEKVWNIPSHFIEVV